MDFAVDPKFRRKGWGDQLMKQELDQFKPIQIETIELQIHYLNAKVVPYYYRYRFRLQTVKLNEFGPGHDVIEMVRKNGKKTNN